MLSETEKRGLFRHRVLKAGTIEFGGSAIDCTVRNLSATGAALDVPSPVVSSDALRFACRVLWRKAQRIGVRFD
jgi:PilZ domain